MKNSWFMISLIAFFSVGCQSIAHGPIDSQIGANSTPNYAVVETFYATDRAINPSGASISEKYTAERGVISYGKALVSIPREHRQGHMESPSIFKLEFRQDPEKHVVLLDAISMPDEVYFSRIKKVMAQSGRNAALIFIHGYNVNFEDAARRTAQLSYDLGFVGAPVFYSWPSHGEFLKYPADEDNVVWAQTHIEKFLNDFCSETNAQEIYLIGHSMGTRSLTRAYISLLEKNPTLKNRFKEIILAAPDIDADVFINVIAPAMIATKNTITLYASSNDLALKASKAVHKNLRAGDSGDNILILNGIDTIESSNISTDFLGHSYFSSERAMIEDIFLIIKKSLGPLDRGLKSRKGKSGNFWEFPR